MRVIIDSDDQTLHIQDKDEDRSYALYSKEAFEVISKLWMKVGWNEKYEYTFSWFGRPIIQLPEDMIRFQEVVYRVKPDVIVETGIAHGGSLVFSASLCKAMGKGRVIGVDIEIRPHNRSAIEAHELFPFITLLEGNSTDPAILRQIQNSIEPQEIVLVILDSNHTKAHVLAELEAYHILVTSGSYIVATDGVMQDLADTPRGHREWITDNPSMAALEFVKNHPDFIMEQPGWIFNESSLDQNITHWPNAWLRRR